jgi:hypothetical protein
VDDLVLYLVSAVAMALWVILTVLNRGRSVDPAVRYSRAFTLFLGISIAWLTPSTLAFTQALAPGLDWPVMLGDELQMGAVYCLTRFAFAFHTPGLDGPAARRHRALTAATALLAALLFVLAPADRSGSTIVVSAQGRLPLAGYDALITLCTTAAMAVFVTLMRRRAHDCAPGLLRIGLRVIVLSGCFGLLWCAWGLQDVIDVLSRGHEPSGEDYVSAALGITTVSLAAVSATVRLWGSTASSLRSWLVSYRRYRALEPLWRALHRALPQIALDPAAARRSPLPPRNTRFALYRRVIEIHDARLALRPYLPPGITDWVRRTEPDCPAETVEAAAIAAALELLGAEQGPADPGVGDRSGAPAPEIDTDWLVRMAAAFTSAPVVDLARRRVHAEIRAAAPAPTPPCD